MDKFDLSAYGWVAVIYKRQMGFPTSSYMHVSVSSFFHVIDGNI